MAENKMTLYWSFGRNMNVAEMKRRAPDAVKLVHLRVPNGLLMFRGVADVEWSGSSGDYVPGGLWRISAQDEKNLDRFEGWNKDETGLYVKRYLTLQIDGAVERAMYYKHSSEGIMPPSDEYIDAIAQGYRDFDLESDLIRLEEALQRSWDQRRKTPDLHHRWVRKGSYAFAKSTLKPTNVVVDVKLSKKARKKAKLKAAEKASRRWWPEESRLIKKSHVNGCSQPPEK